MKLLVFINRDTFYKICSEIGKAKLTDVSYRWLKEGTRGGEWRYFPDDKVMSLSSTGLAIHEISELSAIQAPIIFIADESIELVVSDGKSKVEDAYKLLYHNKTSDRPTALAAMKDSAQCSQPSNEERIGTPYSLLAQFINDGATEEELKNFVNTVCNPALDQALNLLHACLTPSGAATINQENYPNVWSDDVNDLVKNLQGQTTDQIIQPSYVTKLTQLREVLLPSALGKTNHS